MPDVATNLMFIGAVSLVTAGYAAAADQQQALEALRAKVTTEAATMLVKDADIQVRFSYAPLVAAVDKLNSQPVPERTIKLVSTAQNGNLWDNGPDWCNSSLYLAHNDGIHGQAVLSAFKASPDSDGSLSLQLHAEIGVSVAAHWHFKGHSFNKWFGPIKVHVCPPGGGFGGDIGGHGETSLDEVARLEIGTVPSSAELSWSFMLMSPPETGVTLKIGFEHIGELGIPQTFTMPVGLVASGRLPLLLLEQGDFRLPDGTKRSYAVTLSPVSFQTTSVGIVAGWKAQINFPQPGL